PPSKTAKLRNDISTYTQMESESLYEAWERYKDLLRRCPHHGLPTWLQVQTFYNGLIHGHKAMIDAAAGGTLNNKTPEAGYELIDEMATNSYQWHVDRTVTIKQAGVHNVDAVTVLAAQIELLNKKINGMSMGTVMACDLCGANGHNSVDCQMGNPFAQSTEQINYAGNFNKVPQNNPYSNTYYPGWRNHPNFSWANQSNHMPSPPMYNQPQIDQKPSLEELMSKFISTSEARFQNQDASIKNLETQVGQLVKMMSERARGTLPSNTEPNLRGQLNALFSGSTEEASNEQTKPELSTLEEKPLTVQENLAEHKLEILDPKPKVENKEREKIEQLIDTLKQIKVNVPLIDTLLHMPNHIKNLEEILRNKRKLDEADVVTLSEESSAILQHKLPPKLEDPGGFTIPCTIGSLTVDDALADLGAGINVMPYKKFKKLGIGELRPTKMSIHLANRTIRHPRGIIENILVRVDKFLFPIDFVVLDMDESFKTPLILGRPFLATARALIDVEQRELILRVREERVVLQMNDEALKL